MGQYSCHLPCPHSGFGMVKCVTGLSLVSCQRLGCWGWFNALSQCHDEDLVKVFRRLISRVARSGETRPLASSPASGSGQFSKLSPGQQGLSQPWNPGLGPRVSGPHVARPSASADAPLPAHPAPHQLCALSEDRAEENAEREGGVGQQPLEPKLRSRAGEEKGPEKAPTYWPLSPEWPA